MKHDAHGEPDLSPDEQRIQALLRSVRTDEPVPADVARRLDATLADLQAAVASPPAPEVDATASVTSLETRAARRRAPARVLLGLAAGTAAAVSIGAVVLPQMSGLSAGGAGSESSTASSSGGASSEQLAAGEPSQDSAREGVLEGGALADASEVADAAALPRVRRSSFASDVQGILSSRAVSSSSQAATGPSSPPADLQGGPGSLAATETSEEVAEAQSDSTAPTQDRRKVEGGLSRRYAATVNPATCDAGIAAGRRQQSFVARLDRQPVLVIVGPTRASAYACDAAGAGDLLGQPPRAILTRRLG